MLGNSTGESRFLKARALRTGLHFALLCLVTCPRARVSSVLERETLAPQNRHQCDCGACQCIRVHRNFELAATVSL